METSHRNLAVGRTADEQINLQHFTQQSPLSERWNPPTPICNCSYRDCPQLIPQQASSSCICFYEVWESPGLTQGLCGDINSTQVSVSSQVNSNLHCRFFQSNSEFWQQLFLILSDLLAYRLFITNVELTNHSYHSVCTTIDTISNVDSRATQKYSVCSCYSAEQTSSQKSSIECTRIQIEGPSENHSHLISMSNPRHFPNGTSLAANQLESCSISQAEIWLFLAEPSHGQV